MIPTVTENDWVILFTSFEELSRIKVENGLIHQSRAGRFFHEDIIGQPYGTRVRDRKIPAKSAIILPNSPEFRTLTIDHRTQIVWGPDIAYITTILDLKAGSRVLETGTGSGSVTLSFSRTVGPSGHVFTFEFHQMRFEQAKREFAELGLDHNITCFNRDAYSDGFSQLASSHPDFNSEGSQGVPLGSIDAAFIDLPQPWLALDNVDAVLKPNHKVVLFSPCYEQVQATCAKLRELRYHDIDAVEVVCKPWTVWTASDAERRAQRTEAARLANIKANRTTKDFKEVDRTSIARFDPSPNVFLQLPMKGHTSYLIIATKPPASG